MHPWRAILPLLLLLHSSAADILVFAESTPVKLFAAGVQPVPIFIHNGPAETKVSLEFRLYQLATDIGAPIGPKQPWKQLPLHAAQTIREELPLRLPSVRAATDFALKLFESNSEKELATIRIRAYPANLLAELKEPLKERELILMESDEAWRRQFTAAGIEFTTLKNLSDPILAEKPAILFTTQIPEEGAVADLSRIVEAIIHPTSDIDALPIEGAVKNKAFVVTYDPQLLQANPVDAQLNTIRLVQYALRRGASRIKD